jgi:hypothetical protein
MQVNVGRLATPGLHGVKQPKLDRTYISVAERGLNSPAIRTFVKLAEVP